MILYKPNTGDDLWLSRCPCLWTYPVVFSPLLLTLCCALVLPAVAQAGEKQAQIKPSSEDRNFTYYPKDIKIPADVDYLHITSNNTIRGTEIFEDLDSPVPLICDMSSDICSRPVDVSKYVFIYGGC